MTDENDDLEQTFKRINKPTDLVDAIQNLIDNPNKVNYIPAHMRGNVRLGSDGINYYEKGALPLDIWNKVYIKVISCYVRLRGQGHNKFKLPNLPETINPDPIVNLQIIQDKCLNTQEIVPQEPTESLAVGIITDYQTNKKATQCRISKEIPQIDETATNADREHKTEELTIAKDPSRELAKQREGEWSKEMAKSEMMAKLNIDSYYKFNQFAKRYDIKPVEDNRQLFTIRLDKMNPKDRGKLEKK